MSEPPPQPSRPVPPGPAEAYPPAPPPAHPAAPPPAHPAAPPPAYPPVVPGQPGEGRLPYATYVPVTSPFPVSTVVLLAVSVVSLVATGIIGLPSAVVAVLAWRRNATDPAAARHRTTTGWVVYGVNFAVGVPLLVWFYMWALGSQ